ncbi:hypothetical protein YYC_02394 [Plasmodium yoelii 17X]|uniref:Uncharacterized protein n=1 Tax=Plasmodium yoelii 17X TaxID=1323249 RepID=V7PKA6_PLAYE|nr:hypothetical protein YYC_02394 [Plasmodium yoelii 17X]
MIITKGIKDNNLCKIVLYIHMIKNVLTPPPNKAIYLTTIKCGRFSTLRNFLPDELGKTTNLKFHDNGKIKNYCPNQNCNTDLDKINAACLWLLKQTIVNNIDSLTNEELKAFIIYIMIWLSYMLNLKNVNNINYLKDFYEKHIKNNSHYTKCNESGDDCSDSLKDKLGYDNFKEFIKENECIMSISIIEMSKYYDAFKLLCEIYAGGNTDKSSCTKNLKTAQEFAKKYKELSDGSSITENSSCSQIFLTLSNDYNSLKKKCNELGCNEFPPLPEKTTIQGHVQSSKDKSVEKSEENSVQGFGATLSNSSITNKLIPVLSIFAAIPIFLGIAYKVNNKEFKK